MQNDNFPDNKYRLTRFEDSPEHYPSLYAGHYNISDRGVSMVTGEGDNEKTVIICTHPIQPVEILKNIDSGNEKLKIGFNRHGYWEEIIVDREILASKNKIIEIAKYGIIINSETARYMMVYLNHLEAWNSRENLPLKKSIGRLGWIHGHGFSPYDSNLVFDGHGQFGQVFESIKEYGDYNLWLDTIKSIRTNGITARILLAASFASALIEPLKKLPFYVHLWGGTSSGKTVGLLMAASVWGNPNEGYLMRNFNTTTVGIELLATVCNSIPLCINELQIGKNKDMDSQIYSLCEGTGRTRGNKNLGVSKAGTWSNCFLTNGEQPITSENSGAGAINRILEIECRESLFKDPVYVNNVMRDNYGFLGEKWVQFIKANIPEIQEKFDVIYRKILTSDTTDKQAMAAALVITADYFATKIFFKDGMNLKTEDIIGFLSTKSRVSSQQRAYEFICQWVAINDNRFDTLEKGEKWGRYEDESKRIVYIIGSKFDEVLKKEGYHSKVMLSWLAEKNLIEYNRSGHKKNARVNGSVIACVALRIDQESDSFEPVDEENPF